MENAKKLTEAGYGEAIILTDLDFDAAIIGVTGEGVVVYDYNKMLECLMVEHGCSLEEAVEHIDFNTIRAIQFMGEYAPIIMIALEDL